MDNWVVVTEEPRKNEKPKYGLTNISVDNNSFKSWLLSDPYGEGGVCIADMIQLIKPVSLNIDIANYFFEELLKRVNYLTPNKRHRLIDKIKKSEAILPADAETIKAALEESYSQKQNLHLVGPNYETFRIVRRWADENKNKVSGYYIFWNSLKLNPLFDEKLSINGRIVKSQIFSSAEIDMIASYPNRVIVIVDYQFLDENVKTHISLLKGGYVVDRREEKGYKKLDNIQFVCTIEDKE